MTYKTYVVVVSIPQNLVAKLDGDDSIENACAMINNILGNASKGFVAPTVRPFESIISAVKAKMIQKVKE